MHGQTHGSASNRAHKLGKKGTARAPVRGCTAVRPAGFCFPAHDCAPLLPSLSPFSLSFSHCPLRPPPHTHLPAAVAPLPPATPAAALTGTLLFPFLFALLFSVSHLPLPLPRVLPAVPSCCRRPPSPLASAFTVGRLHSGAHFPSPSSLLPLTHTHTLTS